MLLLRQADIIKVNQDQGLFEWLSPSHWEVTGLLLANVDRHLTGTLQWVHTMPELCSWLTGDEAKVLWFTGLPGVGKSVIAAHVIKTLYPSISEGKYYEALPSKRISPCPLEPRAERYLTFFFCKSGEQKLENAHNIIRTISYQLARQNEMFLRELGEIRFSEHFTAHSSVGIRLLYNRLLEQPLAAAARTTTDQLQILCVIDGLDEADFTARDGHSGISEIQILLQLLSKTDRIRLLIVSRAIRELFETLNLPNSVIKEISSTDNSGDIERYVQWKISASEKLERGFRHLKMDLGGRLHDSSGGNFLWIDTVLRYLETSPSLNDFELSLHEIPDQFCALYRQILRRITETVPLRTRAVIKEIIRATITSPRELEVLELQTLVEEFTKDNFFDFTHLIKSVCGTFLRIVDHAVNPKVKYVRVVHETFRDFITTNASEEEEFHVSLPQAHAEMAESLLQLLLKHHFGSQLLKGKDVEVTEEIVEEIQQRFPMLRYAVTQWSYHLSRASVEHMWVKKLQLMLQSFLHHGPILLWLEALAFYEIKALSKVRAEVILWHTLTLPVLGNLEFSALLHSWVRDITRLSQEYSTVLARRPGSVYYILFDLFPCPSLLHSRYKKNVALVSGGVSDPLHPAIVGVSNIYDLDYDLAAFRDGPEKLLALSSLRHIRVGHQVFGESIGLIQPLDSDRWAVLAMDFSNSREGQRNMLAVVHVPLFDNETPYHPVLSIWDVDTLTLIAKTALCEPHYKTLCLVNWVEFSDDSNSVRCGCWKYKIEGRNLAEDNTYNVSINAEAVVLSRNGQYALRLNPGDGRTLVDLHGRTMSFAKPPFYHYETDDPAKAQPDDVGFQRWLVAPVHWWQLWREVTRAYQFSPDSRWFARFTKEHCVAVCDLETFTERIVHRPEESWTCILMNNLDFDAASERLIWKFHYNNSSDTRVHIWNTTSTSTGFYLGRCGWMERVAFCSDTSYVLTYRAAVTVWDLRLAYRVDETSQVQNKADDWVVVLENWYNSDYSIQLGYSPQKILYCLIREEVPEGLFTVQVFDRQIGMSRRVSFQSQSLLQTTRWGPHWTTNGEVFATENAIVNVSDVTNMTLLKYVDILPPRTLLASAYHIGESLIACLQQCDSVELFSLQVYNIDDNKLLKAITFVDVDYGSKRRPSKIQKHPDAVMLFDPTSPPTYLFVMMAPDEVALDMETRPRDLYSSVVDGSLPWRVWVFQLPSLEQETTFQIAGSGAIRTPYTRMTGLVVVSIGKIICIQESKHSVSCALWVIDINNHAWSLQCFPSCLLLTFVASSGMMVALTAEGWLQCKRINEMDSDIMKYGNGKHTFNGINDEWIWRGWKKLLYLPASYLPCYESAMAIQEEGELAYVDEYGKRLVQISFKW